MPGVSRNFLKCLLETFRLIFVADPNGGNIIHLANEDEFDPTGNGAVAMISLASL